MGILPVNKVVMGDCFEVMQGWTNDCIDLVVTSPPYWGLRDYGVETVRVWGGISDCDHDWGESLPAAISGHKNIGFAERSQKNYKGGAHKAETIAKKKTPIEAGQFCSTCGAWRGSLGLEPHPQLFIDHLTMICREIKRVLKPSGTFWLNLGDTYFGGGGGNYGSGKSITSKNPHTTNFLNRIGKDGAWLQPKQKLMIPARVAIALQHDGWILRNDIIWYKPNHMPSPVKDRLTCSYEHVFLFAKARHYYFDLDVIREPSQTTRWGKNPKYESEELHTGLEIQGYHQLGKNPGDVWRIPTTPFPGAHFATFPPKLIEPIIKAGCPRWICSNCGQPRTRITKDKSIERFDLPKGDPRYRPARYEGKYSGGQRYHSFETVGWSDCGCKADWVGGVVLDPFAGSGTALRVARRLGRRFVGIEINPEYADMARQRVRGRYKPVLDGATKLTDISEVEK